VRRVLVTWAILLLALWGCARNVEDVPTEGEWILEWEKLPKDSVTVGDPIRVSLSGSLPAGGDVIQSPWETLSTDFVLRDAGAVRRQDLGDTLTLWRQVVTLVPFQVGSLQFGPLSIPVAAGEDTVLEMSNALQVRVASVMGDSAAADLRDIKPPYSLGRAWWPFAVAAAAFVLALIAASLVWRRRRRDLAGERPLPPPWEEFQQGLRELEARNLPEKGEWGVYTLDLSWIVRRYLERRFEAPVLKMTTMEIGRWVARADLHAKQESRLLRWLGRTDLIKFAGSVPTLGECGELREEARDLIGGVETFWQERQSQEKEPSPEPFVEKTGTET
jgi:hypothetical protein